MLYPPRKPRPSLTPRIPLFRVSCFAFRVSSLLLLLALTTPTLAATTTPAPTPAKIVIVTPTTHTTDLLKVSGPVSPDNTFLAESQNYLAARPANPDLLQQQSLELLTFIVDQMLSKTPQEIPTPTPIATTTMITTLAIVQAGF